MEGFQLRSRIASSLLRHPYHMPLQLFHSAGEIAQSCRIALEKRCFVGGNAMWDQGNEPNSCMVVNKIGHCLPFNISYIAALTVNEVKFSPLDSIHILN